MSNKQTLGIFVDAATNDIFERALSLDEKKTMSDRSAYFKVQKEHSEAKALARESALSKLADLGLTAEEIAAL